MTGINTPPLAQKIFDRFRPLVVDDGIRDVAHLVPLPANDRLHAGFVYGGIVRDALENFAEGGHFTRFEAVQVELVVESPEQVNAEAHEGGGIVDGHGAAACHADIDIGQGGDQLLDGVCFGQHVGTAQ